MSIHPSTVLAALSAHETLSGSDLARRLGVTRAAVWKQIETLRELGAPIEAAAGSGYRLAWNVEALDAAAIQRDLAPEFSARLGALDVHWHIESTNTALLTAAAGGARDLSVTIAEMQSGGRGRRGRVWQSPLGGNVYFSLLRRFSGGMGALSGLSIVSGIAALRALTDCGVAGVQLKWPNDLVANDKKLAGILVELGGEFLGPCFAVIGIGINLRSPRVAAIDQPFTDLAALCGGVPPSRTRVVARLIEHLIDATDHFIAHGLASMESEYARHDALAGRAIVVQTAGATRNGIAQGIDTRGALRVKHGNETIAYDSAEVSIRPA